MMFAFVVVAGLQERLTEKFYLIENYKTINLKREVKRNEQKQKTDIP